jgi:Flp pilus assembly protein TadD
LARASRIGALARLHRAYAFEEAAEQAGAAGDMESAASNMMNALRLAPDNAEIAFYAAMGTAMAGQLPLARQLLAQAVSVDPRWKELVRRMPCGAFPLSAETITELTELL